MNWLSWLGLSAEDFQDLPPTPAATPAATPEAPPAKSDRYPRVSLLIPAREATHALENTLSEAHSFLSRRHGSDFEIILIPNPPAGVERDASIQLSEDLAARFENVRVVPLLAPPFRPGKGSALRTGFFASRGEIVLFTDADLPYDLSFFDTALRRLDQGFDLVTANRRLPDSRFDIPTSLLSIAYGRHRLGLLFNRFVRLFFPLTTSDTQAGIKAMSRRLARLAFSGMRCPGFFFDLELFLFCQGQGWMHAEAPITLRLNTEKSTVRVLRESVLALYWLLRVAQGYRQGFYGKAPRPPVVLRSYFDKGIGVDLKTRIFLALRWWLTPYDKMAAHLPRQGVIYDLGCGHGLFSLKLARSSKGRKVLGLDHDEARIRIAQAAALGRCGISARFETGDLSRIPKEASDLGPPDGISMIDVLHYFDFPAQKACLEHARDLLSPKGVLIFREVDPDGGWIASWNRWYEKVATSVGFTRSKEQNLYFRTREEWLQLLTEAGFRARAERCSSLLFADVLYVAEPALESEAVV